MSRHARDEQAVRVKRSLSLLVLLTAGALYALDGDPFPPHGNPLLYAFAMSWLVAIPVSVLTSPIFRVNPRLFPLARWEKDGEVYGRIGIRAFRWVLLHSPLGSINPDLHLSVRGRDCTRLLRELNVSEGVHWVTCCIGVILAISYLVEDYAVYGYVMLLVRIPFDLYPIMLQRWNRGRVGRVLSRQLPSLIPNP